GLAAAEYIQKIDPLDFLSLTEKYFSLKNLGREAQAKEVYDEALRLSRLDSDNYLELAIRYARCGQYAHAVRILEILTAESNDVSPLVYYYLAWYDHRLGNEERAAAELAKGSALPTKYVFPNRLETIPVLDWALSVNPRDGHAYYFQGDLLRESFRAEEALAAWKKSVELDPANVVAWRNIGQALAEKGEFAQAQKAYQAAVKADPTAAMAVQELDEVNEKLGMERRERIAMLEQNMETVGGRDPLLKRLISLYVQTGRYDDALTWLSDHHFHSWEGRYDIHQYWVESHLSKGDQLMAQRNFQKALEQYQLALTYPFNLEVASQPRAVNARNNYKLAAAFEALGKKSEARKTFELVLADQKKMRGDNADQYFRGKALEKLGRNQEARSVYEEMLATLDRMKREEEEREEDEPVFDPNRNPEAVWHFKRALALEGLGRTAEADAERAKATGEDPIVALRAFSPPRAGW
ncbi:MAG: tetratricopeptide repeat protein, partial [Candidatus Glassbacteria bacterium]